jgi:hypothetical protein
MIHALMRVYKRSALASDPKTAYFSKEAGGGEGSVQELPPLPLSPLLQNWVGSEFTGYIV